MSIKKSQTGELPLLPQILVHLRDRLPALNGAERTLVEYILINYALIPHRSLVQLAEDAQVNPSDVCRLCDDLGLEGYHVLQEAIAEIDSVAVSVFFEGIETSDLAHLVGSVFRHIINAIEQTLESLDLNSVEQAVNAIATARHIVVLGVGASASIAQELAYRLQWIGLNCYQNIDPHRQLMGVALLGDQDVVIGISHSGQTRNVVAALKLAHERGIKTICITDFPHSPINEYAQIRLHPVRAERSLGVEMVSTRAAQLAMIDALATAVALRDKKRAIASIKLNERLLSSLHH